MTTQNYSELNDIIVPTNDKFTYRGFGGDDTYILISKNDTSIDIVDTDGSNIIQLPEWSKIKSISFTSDAVRITCDDMTIFTINGADKFSYDIGGNKTNNEIGKVSTFSEFAALFDVEIPVSGQVSVEDDKIVYNDKLAELYSVEVKKEDNGNKYYINGELSPDLDFSSGKTYIFDQNDSSTSKHPLAISLTKNGTHDGGTSIENIKFFVNGYNKTETEYSDIFSNDDPFDNAFVVFSPELNDTQLYYYCLFHSGMANDSKILIDGFQEEPVAETVTATLSIINNGASDYLISDKNDPTLTLERGKTYEFDVNAPGHPFWIKTINSTGTGNSYSEGITNNGASNGTIVFKVPDDAPDQLYYNCQIHSSMNGIIKIVDTNSSGVIVSESTSNTSTGGSGGGGYGYTYDLITNDDFSDLPTISYDI
tara:strand:+ start:544 stop:1815 length:1272 start_codon:yes stop_codon:yes gene_type:complete